jgi:hypothetical protein
VEKALPQTTIAATSFGASSNDFSLLVLYAAHNLRLSEQAWVAKTGILVDSTSLAIPDTSPGIEAAVINWDYPSDHGLLVYLQKSELVTGTCTTECMWRDDR